MPTLQFNKRVVDIVDTTNVVRSSEVLFFQFDQFEQNKLLWKFAENQIVIEERNSQNLGQIVTKSRTVYWDKIGVEKSQCLFQRKLILDSM